MRNDEKFSFLYFLVRLEPRTRDSYYRYAAAAMLLLGDSFVRTVWHHYILLQETGKQGLAHHVSSQQMAEAWCIPGRSSVAVSLFSA